MDSSIIQAIVKTKSGKVMFICKPQSENLKAQLMLDAVQIKTLCLYFIASAQISLLFYIPIQNLPGEEPKNQ